MNGFVFVFVYLRWGQTRLMGAALEDKEMEEVEEEGSWQWIRFSLSSGFIFVNRSRWRTGVLFRLRYKVVLTSAKPCELMMDDSALSRFGDCGAFVKSDDLI